MTTDDIKNYYAQLLIIQYRNRTKASGTILALADTVVADQIIASVRDAFNIDTAIGTQLDVLGKYRGITRFIYGLNLTKNYFSMPSTVDSDKGTVMGFASAGAADSGITWYFFRSQDLTAVAYQMNDQEFRQVIKFRAQTHSSDLSLEDIDQILNQFFGTYVKLTDNQNMTITYTHGAGDPSNLYMLVKNSNSLPKPAGVSLLYA